MTEIHCILRFFFQVAFENKRKDFGIISNCCPTLKFLKHFCHDRETLAKILILKQYKSIFEVNVSDLCKNIPIF